MNLAERLKYESAYQEGMRAYTNYNHTSNNPYPEHNPYLLDHSEWENGYCDQRAIDNGDL